MMQKDRSRAANRRIRDVEAILPHVLKSGRRGFEDIRPDQPYLENRNQSKMGPMEIMLFNERQQKEKLRCSSMPSFPRPLDPGVPKGTRFLKINMDAVEYARARKAKQIQDWEDNNSMGAANISLKTILKVDDSIDLRDGSYLLTYGGRIARTKEAKRLAEIEAEENKERARIRRQEQLAQLAEEAARQAEIEASNSNLRHNIGRFDRWMQKYLNSGDVFR